jgi:hypothetical protein
MPGFSSGRDRLVFTGMICAVAIVAGLIVYGVSKVTLTSMAAGFKC